MSAKTFRIILVFSLLPLLIGTQAYAQPKSPTPEQIHQLITSSGLQLQIQQIPLALQQAGQGQTGPASAFIQPLMSTLQSVFKPQEMLDILTQDLIKRLDVPTMLDALSWYNSANGRDVVNAQKRMMDPKTMEKVANVLMSQETQISESRKNLLQQIAEATRSTSAALDMMVNMQAAFMSGLSHMVAPSQAQTFTELHHKFEKSKGVMESQLAHQLLLQQAVVLEELSDDTLKTFLSFAQSPSGQKLFVAINQSLDHTLQVVAQKIPSAVRDDS